MSADTDAMLRGLLAAPARNPDEAFALRVERAVRAEQRLRAARRAAWSRFVAEMAAAATLIAAFVLIERRAPADSLDMASPFGPAAVGLLLLALWVFVSIRPDFGARDL
ncbi:MAG: hypothetical protein QOH81_2825 [Sphingomonadales bacterium]|jgi:uncharacterized RDD family membrane protein YckC|nr:hypothetical protein [Sphingomonadales bacterium]